MLITTAQKLQLLILVGCLAIGCYFYILHKDLERTVGELHERVQYLMKVTAAATAVPPVAAVNASSTLSPVDTGKQTTTPASTTTAPVHTNTLEVFDDDADVASVTSNDIKDLLTNIYNEDVDPDEPDTLPIVEANAEVVESSSEAEEPSTPVVVEPRAIDIDEPATTTYVTAETVDITVQGAPKRDVGMMSDKEIMAMKYDDLRNYLRKHGVHMKGNKAEMLVKIREINKHLEPAA